MDGGVYLDEHETKKEEEEKYIYLYFGGNKGMMCTGVEIRSMIK
jgi:hypothetical protein